MQASLYEWEKGFLKISSKIFENRRLRKRKKPAQNLYSMTLYLERPFLRAILCTAAILTLLTSHVPAGEGDEDDNDGQATYVSSGQRITPTAAPRAVLQPLNPGLPDSPDFVSSGGVSSIVSPDQKTLLVLTSGHNQLNDKSGVKVSADSQ